MDRVLIINADDLGCNPQRTHGIFQCMEFGVVTSATILPNMSDSDTAARHARERGFHAGLHLNLTDEYPLSAPGDVASMVDANGRFIGEDKLRAGIASGAVDARHLDREVRAQFEWILDHYGTPTHVDGHEHIHLLPAVIEVLCPLLERYGVRFVRIPVEEPLPPFGFEIEEKRVQEIYAINIEASAARTLYAVHGIASTDHFRGETLLQNASVKNLRHVINKLPEGVTELMVHPGSPCAYGTPFDLDPQRQTELRMLLDESIPALIKEKNIRLCSYADL